MASFASEIGEIGKGGMENKHYNLCHLIERIPVDDARELLIKYWSHLHRSNLFLHAALAIGGFDLEVRVDEAIREWKKASVSPFKHLGIRLFSGTVGETSRVDLPLLQRLLPYIESMDEMNALMIAQACRQRGFTDWGRTHLASRLPESVRQEQFPTTEDLLLQLDDLLAQGEEGRPPSVWARYAVKHSDGVVDVLQVLKEWLNRNAARDAFWLAVPIVSEIGRRAGVELLERHAPDKSPQVVRRLAELRFWIERSSLE